MRFLVAVVGLLTVVAPARAQFQAFVSVKKVNRELAGQVVDLTHNHGHDRRLYSPILGMPRDLYVYLPPGYTPAKSYPLVLYLHGAFGDEHAFLDGDRIQYLDQMIARGCIPPLILACPDGTYLGRNRVAAEHSLYINGCGGRFEEHLMREVLPYLMRCYSISPERQAHGLLGLSAGGLGAMSVAIRRRDVFGAVATLAGPVNMRYANIDRKYREDFDPATYRWATEYDPRVVVGIFASGLLRIRAKTFIEPVFGTGDAVIGRIASVNPADLLFTTNLQPGELALYVSAGTRDNLNFDAQAASFAWLAASRGIDVTLVRVPDADHSLKYFQESQKDALLWLGRHLLPPTDHVPTASQPPGG